MPRLSKDFIRSRLKTIGNARGVKVYPHRLRHTCATQLLNAGCRITSIQAFSGAQEAQHHHDLCPRPRPDRGRGLFHRHEPGGTAPGHRPIPKPEPETEYEVVKVPERADLAWVEQLALPELRQKERLEIAENLKRALSLSRVIHLSPPVSAAAPV